MEVKSVSAYQLWAVQLFKPTSIVYDFYQSRMNGKTIFAWLSAGVKSPWL